jgi:hypothetical protein
MRYYFFKHVGHQLPPYWFRELPHNVVDLIGVSLPSRFVLQAKGSVETLLDKEKHIFDFGLTVLEILWAEDVLHAPQGCLRCNT